LVNKVQGSQFGVGEAVEVPLGERRPTVGQQVVGSANIDRAWLGV